MPEDDWIQEALDKIFAETATVLKRDDKLRKDLESLVQWAYNRGGDADAQAANPDNAKPDNPRMRWVRQTAELHRLARLLSNIETVPLSREDAHAIIRFVRMKSRGERKPRATV